ncbi:dynein axonemal intermediate chain 7-like isoform X2 [Corvus hawaiiensis]|uniref:dynein axonemal intermediate chain 7-like isoform X2 n=1 Tax=Corvus hawaiiensis TaxID=134902 RepID=UPI0020192DCC|nr:dynein axonemal intermediate chain 7-like isoform X2 [Corvus hawaiiensis]
MRWGSKAGCSLVATKVAAGGEKALRLKGAAEGRVIFCVGLGGPKPKKKSNGKTKDEKPKKGRDRKQKDKGEAQLQAEQEEAERLEKERLEREHLKKLEEKYQGARESELAELNSLEQKFLSAQQWKMDYREQAKHTEKKCGQREACLVIKISIPYTLPQESRGIVISDVQWEHYLSCDGSPDPTVPQEMNTFMSLWREDQDESVQLVMEKGEVVLKLIEKLEFLLLEASPNEITEEQRVQYQEFILQLQVLLHQKYNEATQNLLKIASMYEDSETGNMHTVIKDKNTTFCIWVNLKKKPRFKTHMFQEAGHGFDLPKSLALSSVAVRVLHTRYDHVSPLWLQCQGLPRQEASDNEESAEHPKDNGQEPGEQEEKGREEPSVPAAEETPSKERKESAASLTENSNNTDDKKETEEETEKNSDILDEPSQEEGAVLQEEPGGREEAAEVVDPQQLVPVGGVYHIDALQLPPQAQDVRGWSMVELLDVGLEVYPYSPGEAEDGTQAAVQITLRLPDNVIYFEAPVVARWDPAGQQWRTDGISNITYEAQERSITFGMGAFYTVALLQDAHLNLPYQAWELQPTGVDEGLFTVTAVFATIQIQIKDNQCMLSSVVVEEEEVLSHITGQWMSPFALREALKRAGVNIFPAEHSHKYVPVPRKAALAEGKAYEQMALLAAAFAFAHSKWNGEAGPEQVVFKVSEHLKADSAKDNHWSLYMFNGEKVQTLKLTETSEAFSEELEEESEFHSTLYHMLKDLASKEAMDKVERAGSLFIDSVYQLLLATRVLAFS